MHLNLLSLNDFFKKKKNDLFKEMGQLMRL